MPARGPFQEQLGYSFKQPDLLKLALTHPSVSHEKGKRLANNQRLEFLGDAVLQLVISAELYKQFPDRDEGALSKACARLVNREALAERAMEISLSTELVLSRGEEKNNGRERPSALADAFEALIGAIYLDGGFTQAKKFIRTRFKDVLAGADTGRHTGNPKGELQAKMPCPQSTGCWRWKGRIMTARLSAPYATAAVNWHGDQARARRPLRWPPPGPPLRHCALKAKLNTPLKLTRTSAFP